MRISDWSSDVCSSDLGLVMAGTDAQKAAWLPRIARGEIITSFALTEPDVGSDSGAVQTRAVKDGDVYRLSGTKRFITNADKADRSEEHTSELQSLMRLSYAVF